MANEDNLVYFEAYIQRPDLSVSWGFDVCGGMGQKVRITKIHPKTLAELCGLLQGDKILKSGDVDLFNLGFPEVMREFDSAMALTLTVERIEDGSQPSSIPDEPVYYTTTVQYPTHSSAPRNTAPKAQQPQVTESLVSPTAALCLADDAAQQEGGDLGTGGRRVQSKIFNKLHDMLESGQDVTEIYSPTSPQSPASPPLPTSPPPSSPPSSYAAPKSPLRNPRSPGQAAYNSAAGLYNGKAAQESRQRFFGSARSPQGGPETRPPPPDATFHARPVIVVPPSEVTDFDVTPQVTVAPSFPPPPPDVQSFPPPPPPPEEWHGLPRAEYTPVGPPPPPEMDLPPPPPEMDLPPPPPKVKTIPPPIDTSGPKVPPPVALKSPRLFDSPVKKTFQPVSFSPVAPQPKKSGTAPDNLKPVGSSSGSRVPPPVAPKTSPLPAKISASKSFTPSINNSHSLTNTPGNHNPVVSNGSGNHSPSVSVTSPIVSNSPTSQKSPTNNNVQKSLYVPKAPRPFFGATSATNQPDSVDGTVTQTPSQSVVKPVRFDLYNSSPRPFPGTVALNSSNAPPQSAIPAPIAPPPVSPKPYSTSQSQQHSQPNGVNGNQSAALVNSSTNQGPGQAASQPMKSNGSATYVSPASNSQTHGSYGGTRPVPRRSVFDLEGFQVDEGVKLSKRHEQDSKKRANYAAQLAAGEDPDQYRPADTSARYEERPDGEEVRYKGYTNPGLQSRTFRMLQTMLDDGDPEPVAVVHLPPEKQVVYHPPASAVGSAAGAITPPPSPKPESVVKHQQFNSPSGLYSGSTADNGGEKQNLNPSTLALIAEMDAQKSLGYSDM